MGSPKTLTPCPWAPTTDRVHGLPTGRSTVYHYGPLYGPPPKTKYKTKVKISYSFSNRSLVSAKFRALWWERCNTPGFSFRSKLVTVHCHFLCCGYKYEWNNGKILRSLEICAALSALRKFNILPRFFGHFNSLKLFRYLRLKSAVFLNFKSHTQRPLSYKW